jgi:hypothetical protein
MNQSASKLESVDWVTAAKKSPRTEPAEDAQLDTDYEYYFIQGLAVSKNANLNKKWYSTCNSTVKKFRSGTQPVQPTVTIPRRQMVSELVFMWLYCCT